MMVLQMVLVIKLIQLINESKPSGLVWVQFDHEDVGKKRPDKKTEIFMLIDY